MKKGKSLFRLIAKALGEKSGKNNEEADTIAIIRLCMFLSIFITNGFIIANAIRHWNDIDYECNVSSALSTEEKERIIEANRRMFPYD